MTNMQQRPLVGSGRAAALALSALMVLGACGRQPDAGSGDTAVGAPAPNMRGGDSMPGGGMMGPMTAHLQRMATATPDSLSRMLPQHRQLVANMLAEMNREMRSMNMPGDAAWNATMDSVRRDLATMPELSAAQLRDMTPAHRDRVMRLVRMHQAMMAGMGR